MALLDDYLRLGVSPVLRQHGFTKKGRTFECRPAEGGYMLWLFRSIRLGSDPKLQATVETSIAAGPDPLPRWLGGGPYISLGRLAPPVPEKVNLGNFTLTRDRLDEFVEYSLAVLPGIAQFQRDMCSPHKALALARAEVVVPGLEMDQLLWRHVLSRRYRLAVLPADMTREDAETEFAAETGTALSAALAGDGLPWVTSLAQIVSGALEGRDSAAGR